MAHSTDVGNIFYYTGQLILMENKFGKPFSCLSLKLFLKADVKDRKLFLKKQ